MSHRNSIVVRGMRSYDFTAKIVSCCKNYVIVGWYRHDEWVLAKWHGLWREHKSNSWNGDPERKGYQLLINHQNDMREIASLQA